jgi:hypothetical protein
MMNMFHEGGWGMIPTALFGAVLVAASLKYALSPERRFVPLLLSLGILTMAAGGLGFVTGLIKSAQAAGSMPDKSVIWVVGMGESLNNVALALGLVALGAIAASVGALRIARVPAVAAA